MRPRPNKAREGERTSKERSNSRAFSGTDRSSAAEQLGAGRLQSTKREGDHAEQAKRRTGREENSKVKSKGGNSGAGGVSKEKLQTCSGTSMQLITQVKRQNEYLG